MRSLKQSQNKRHLKGALLDVIVEGDPTTPPAELHTLRAIQRSISHAPTTEAHTHWHLSASILDECVLLCIYEGVLCVCMGVYCVHIWWCIACFCCFCVFFFSFFLLFLFMFFVPISVACCSVCLFSSWWLKKSMHPQRYHSSTHLLDKYSTEKASSSGRLALQFPPPPRVSALLRAPAPPDD